jgi:dipeptidyl-peptidase-2
MLGALEAFPPTRTGSFTTLVDHFSYRAPAARFDLRYAVYDGFAKRKDAPVLFYCGNEGQIELFYNATGAIFEHGKALGATVFFVEHRYYGSSLPFGRNGSFTPDSLRYLSIEQANADYAELISALPSVIGCSGTGARAAAGRCDVVLFGGSYGGMLAAWHRYKYPHLSVGAIASGAPVDFYPGERVQEAFIASVTQTFGRYGGRKGCDLALTAALAAADAATNEDLIAAGVRPGAPLKPDSVERFAFYARGAMATVAMVDYPYPTDFIAPLPGNPVQAACAALLSGGGGDDFGDRLGRGRRSAPPVARLAGLLNATLRLVNATGELQCLDLEAELVGDPSASAWTAMGQSRRHPPARAHDAAMDAGTVDRWGRGQRHGGGATGEGEEGEGGGDGAPGFASSSALGVTAWNYQACTELILEPLTSDGFGFYPEAATQIDQTIDLCRKRFGVEPRPSWMSVAFGVGADFQHASNIVFMENEKDPWHVGTWSIPKVGGVNGSVSRTIAIGGAHHQDLRFSSELDAPDVHAARAFELAAIRRWLA